MPMLVAKLTVWLLSLAYFSETLKITVADVLYYAILHCAVFDGV